MSDVVKIREIKDTDVPEFGARLLAARVADGRSPQVLATLAGISTAYWYQLEKEERKWVSADIVDAIKSVVGDFLSADKEVNARQEEDTL